jgi:hypothetical protein
VCITDDSDPRDVSSNSFNRFDPKYVSIGPKNPKTPLLSSSKCATLKHTGRFGGSLSPNPKSVSQPSVIQSQQQQQQQQQQLQQHIQLQQHHLQKPNNQQLELQTYQLQQNFQQQQQHPQPQPNYSTISTVSRDYNHQQQQQQHQNFPTASLPYKKPGTGFVETSSILKKHRDEIIEMAKPATSVFSIEAAPHHRQESHHTQTKSISIINQPLPEIPTHQQQPSKSPQVLCAANLSNNYPTANYRSLQRPQPTKASYPSSTTQRQHRESRPAMPTKVMPPVLPPKNRHQNSLSRAQQPLPAIPMHQLQQQHHYPSARGYEREKSRDRDRERSIGRAYDDSHQYRLSSKQHQQQQNFQTLPHHHHHPQSTFTGGSNTGMKSRKTGSRDLLQQPFENYSATEL